MKEQTFKLTALAAALMAVFGTAFADDAQMKELTQPDSAISAGVGNWSHNRPQQGIYDGMRDDGAYALIDADVVRRDEGSGTWLTLNARNLGLDTRALKGEWLRQGDIGATVEYSRIPRDYPWTVNTGLQGIGSTSMTVSGAGASALPKRDIQLGTQRDLVQLGFYKSLMSGLELRVSFKNEEKDGTRHWGLGSNSYFLVEPINSTTRQLEATLQYANEKFQLEGGYYGSWYDNAHSLVFGLINGAAQPGTTQSPNPTPLTLPLDNQAHQLFVNGGYAISPTTRASFKLSYGRATQNEDLPTWGLAAPNDRFVGAPRRLDGRIDTTLVEASISSRPMPKLSVVGNLRYHDMDDKTPLAGFVGNNGTGAITVHNTPHSIKTLSGKLEGVYRLDHGVSLLGGVDLKHQNRSFPLFEAERFVPFRTKLDENTYRIQARRSMSETINGAIAFLHSRRSGSAYLTTEHFPSDLINPIHIADRDRNKLRLSVDWMPMERLSVQAAVEDARDDYGHSDSRPYGLREGSASIYTLDAAFSLNDEWQLTAWYSHDRTEATQFGARWDRVTEAYELDKESRLKDKGDSLGFGVRGELGSGIKVGADLQWTRNASDYLDLLNTAGPGLALTPPAVGGTTARGTVALPNIESKLTRLKLFAHYPLRKSADLRFDLIHERWTSNDWSWNFANGAPFTYGTTADGTTVTASGKQTSNFAGVRYIYKFQ